MDSDTLQTIRETIEKTVKVVVNGKIDVISEKIDIHNEKHEADMAEVRKHIQETKPILEAYRGFNTAGELIKWVAGVGTAVGVLWLMIRTWITGR